MNKFTAQFYRETWEHRGSLTWAPGILMLMMALAVVFTFWVVQQTSMDASALATDPTANEIRPTGTSNLVIKWDSPEIDQDIHLSSPAVIYHKVSPLAGFHNTLYVTCASVMIMLSLFYAMGSLYNDRRDNSILFFKSLPVSEIHVVLTRLAVAAFIMPQLASLAAFVGALLFFASASIYCGLFLDLPWIHPWELINPLSVYWHSVLAGLLAGIWSLPLISWLFISSALAKRMPLAYAILPWMLLAIAVNFITGENHVMTLINWYASGFQLGDFFGNIPAKAQAQVDLMEFFNRRSLLLTLPLSALMISGAIYLRNRHFEI